jgi:hypothetical protein
MHARHRESEEEQTCAGRHSDRGGLPDGRRGRQPMYRTAAEYDDARAEKADAGNDLGRNPGWIDLYGACDEHVAEPVLAHQENGGAAVPTMVCVRIPALLP